MSGFHFHEEIQKASRLEEDDAKLRGCVPELAPADLLAPRRAERARGAARGGRRSSRPRRQRPRPRRAAAGGARAGRARRSLTGRSSMREMNRLPDLGRASPEEANAGGGGKGRRSRCGRLGPLPILLGEGGGESFFFLPLTTNGTWMEGYRGK